METPYFEKLADFSCACEYGGLAPCGSSALLATKKASFGIKTCHLATPRIMEQKRGSFFKISIFLPFMGPKVVFWVKELWFGVLWTGCEVADLKQGQRIFKMNHRNKIQSLLSPTDDPGDTRDCITESGPCTWNMAISAINRPILQNKGFSCNPSWILSPWCC